MRAYFFIEIFQNIHKANILFYSPKTLNYRNNYQFEKNNSKIKWGVTRHLKQNSCEKVFVCLCFLRLSLQSAQVKL